MVYYLTLKKKNICLLHTLDTFSQNIFFIRFYWDSRNIKLYFAIVTLSFKNLNRPNTYKIRKI